MHLGWGAVSDLSLISDLSQKFKHDLWIAKSDLKLSQKQHLTSACFQLMILMLGKCFGSINRLIRLHGIPFRYISSDHGLVFTSKICNIKWSHDISLHICSTGLVNTKTLNMFFLKCRNWYIRFWRSVQLSLWQDSWHIMPFMVLKL